jgi:hypothetical protein
MSVLIFRELEHAPAGPGDEFSKKPTLAEKRGGQKKELQEFRSRLLAASDQCHIPIATACFFLQLVLLLTLNS